MSAKIYNGVPWFDQHGKPVNAHGACVVYEQGRYYLFGEYKTDDVNKYIGFSCYSTADFQSWTFEGMALPPMADGLLGPDRVGERVKVMKCPKTGKYVMLMHTDDMKYCDPCIGLAGSETIQGPYTMMGPLLYQGEPIRRWDMGTFVDEDGTAYLLLHGGDFYRLNDAYTEAVEKVCEGLKPHGESPTVYKHQGVYYALFSNLTSWERNDNFCFTAPSMSGPWTHQGLFCPEGTLTHNSQCSFTFDYYTPDGVLPIYMGDRWSFPMQGSAATLVLLPMTFPEGRLSIPEYHACWSPDTGADIPLSAASACDFMSNRAEETVEIPFEGRRMYLFGRSDSDGGYARVEILRGEQVVHTATIDFYSLVAHEGLRYASPVLAPAAYTLRVTALGRSGEWFQKSGKRFGSSDCFVRVTGYTNKA